MKKTRVQSAKISIQRQFEILEQSLLKQINHILVSNLKATEIRLGEKLDKKLDEDVFLKYKDELENPPAFLTA